MSSQNVSWDIQDQNDRIISILAWVVVVVLVLYAGVYFYKQARNVAERPPLPSDTRLAQAGIVTPPSAPAAPSPSPELALAGGDATRVVSHRPLPHPAPESAPVAPPAPFGTPAAAVAAPTPTPEPPPSASGYAVRFGKSFPTPKNAQDALFQLPVSVSDVDFVQDGDAWLLQLGKFKTLDEAKSLLKKLQPHAPAAEIVSLDAPAPKPAPKAAAKAKPAPHEEPAPRTAAKPKSAKPVAKAAAKPAPRGVADKRGKTAAATTEETEEVEEEAEPAPRRKSKPAADEAGERGTLGAVATGDADESSGTPAEESTEPRRRAATRRSTPASTGEAQPFTADSDASGEVDASPSGTANRRPNARSRRTSAGTETPSESSDEEETAPEETSRRPTNPAGVQQQLASAAREADAGPRRYSLQVGAYSSEDKARQVAGQLRASGLAARVDESVTGETTMYRVRLGSFGDTQEAQTARRRVAGELGFADVRVIRD